MLLKKLQKEGEHIVNKVQFDIRSLFEEKKSRDPNISSVQQRKIVFLPAHFNKLTKRAFVVCR